MKILRYSFVLLLVAAPCIALAAVPLPLVGAGCNDTNDDGFFDDPSDCPNDIVICTSHETEIACLEAKSCSWDSINNSCEGTYWDLVSFVPNRWRDRMKDPSELTMGSGMAANLAWQRHTGSFDTVIAVHDSGIRWHDSELVNKHYLNRDELPVPQNAEGETSSGRAQDAVDACPSADTYDHNQDCVFNIQDYADDPRVDALDSNDPLNCANPIAFNGASALYPVNTVLDPGDLLCVFSDGVDDDGNGYKDDISGWDFLWNDNNPYDDTDFGHGTGESKDSTAEGGNTSGQPGVCPSCSVMNVRVGDSFVVDANNWAAGIVYSVDNGAEVLLSAVGSINNTSFSQAAIEYAYDRGIFNIMSAADETAQHQNYPGAVAHAEYVHAIRYDKEDINQATTWVNFSNCTNFGARLTLSASSTSCSSGATGMTSGTAGLAASALKDTDLGPLSGSEIHQLFIHSVDDVNIASSQTTHAEYNDKLYPSQEGWDAYFGYGRLSAKKMVDNVLDANIPPEADILSPRWWHMIDPTQGNVEITGEARTNRSDGEGTWILEYALGMAPKDGRPVDTTVWKEIATGSTPAAGVLGSFDPTSIENFDPEARVEAYSSFGEEGVADTNVTKADKINRYTITLRLRVSDASGTLEGEDKRAMYVHHDPTWKEGFPIFLGASGESSPKMVDLNGDGKMEIVFGDANGRVHAFTDSGEELSGWPVDTNPGKVVPYTGSYAFTHGPDGNENSGDELESQVQSSIVATIAAADLEGNGSIDVVAATLDGEVYAWNNEGTLLTGFPIDVGNLTGDFNSDDENDAPDGGDTNSDYSTEIGIFSSPVIEDLDGDGDYEIILATLDQHVVALHHDGSVVNGFPVGGVKDDSEPTKPFLRLSYSGNEDGQGRRIISSPAIGDLDGDGNLEIVVGTNEAINESLSLVYAFSFDKDANKPVRYRDDCGSAGNYKNCFPIQMVGGYPNALPYVGAGTPGCPVLADLDGDGTLEVGAASIADFGRIFKHDGYNSFDTYDRAHLELKSFKGFYGKYSNSDQASSLVMINSGAFGDLNGDYQLDYMLGTAGTNFVDNLTNDGERADFDHQLSVWSTDTGEYLPGFPQIMEDLQFFLNPIVADVDGDDKAEVINTSASFVVHAWDADGNRPENWPKFTGQWQIASPAVGDVDGDGLLEMAIFTRAGYLFVYDLDGKADGNVQWSSFRHDARNTGNFHTADATLAVPVKPDEDKEDGGCACGTTTPSAWVLMLLAIFFRRFRRRAA